MSPAARALKFNPPETATGVALLVVEPSPSSPCALEPQQSAAPAVVSPQVCNDGPAARTLNLEPAETATGGPRRDQQ
jgi:hypothetical protein